MPRDLFREVGIGSNAAPAVVADATLGRDLFREAGLVPGAEVAKQPPQDLFRAFGVEAEPTWTHKVSEGLSRAGKAVASAFSPNGSVMEGEDGRIAPPASSEATAAADRTLGVSKPPVPALTSEHGFKVAAQELRQATNIARREALLRPLIRQGASYGAADGILTGIEAEARRRLEQGESPESVGAWASDAYSRPLATMKPSEAAAVEKSGIHRYWNDFAAGELGATGSALAYAGRKTGLESVQRVGESMNKTAEGLTPPRPAFADNLVSAVGSMASFFVPGVGVMKGAAAVSRISPALAKWMGSGAMAGMEAASEADGVYKQNLAQGVPELEAASRADKTFILNLGLLGVTDRIGLFNDIKGFLPKVGVAAAVEGPGQEFPQQVIQNRFTERPLLEGVGEATAIGSIVGAGARVAMPGHSAVAEEDQHRRGDFQNGQTDGTLGAVSERVPGVVGDETTMPRSQTQGLQKLRRARDSSVPAVADGLPSVPGGHGAEAGPELELGSEGQRGALHAGELSLGDGAAAGLQQEDLPQVSGQRPNDDGARGGEIARYPAHDVAESIPDTGIASGAGDAQGPGAVSQGFAVSDPRGHPDDGAGVGNGIGDTLANAARPTTQQGPGSESIDPGASAPGNAIDKAAHQAATSPLNGLPQPTPAQIEAGNYSKGRIKIAGLDISVENPEGSVRRSKPDAAKPWQRTMEHHYGYFVGMPARAPDGEHVDVFVRPGTHREFKGTAFVVDQVDPKTGKFDEPKVMLGFHSATDAREAYLDNYESGWKGIGSITPMSLGELATRLKDPHGFAKPIRYRQGASGRDLLHETGADAREQRSPDAASAEHSGETRPAMGIVMSPGYTGGAEGQTVNSPDARPDAIRNLIRTMLKVPINEGGITRRKAAGIYKVKPQTIRIRNQNDIGVIAHEAGHHFSETSQSVRDLMNAHYDELSVITPYAASQKSAHLKQEEGFAEFMRFYLTAPAQAKAKAPGFYAGFEKYIDSTKNYRAILSQIQGAVSDWMDLSPTERIYAKVGTPPRSPLQRLSEHFSKDRFIFEVLDNWHPMKRLVQDLAPGIAPSMDPFKAAHLLAGDGAIIEGWLTSGTIPFNPEERANTKNYGKSLYEILKPVSGQLREFGAYLIAKRGIELMRAGKEHLFTQEELFEASQLRTPEFIKAAKEIYAYNDRLLQYAIDGGLLSENVADNFRQYESYIPFYREGETQGPRRRGEIFKRLQGGTENLRDPIANLIDNTATVIYATNRNAVLIKARALTRSVPGGGRWIEDVPMPERAVRLETQKIIDTFAEQGVSIDPEMAQQLANMQTFFVKDKSGDDRERIIVVKVKGEPKAVQINDDMLWRSLEAFEPVDLGLVGSMLAIPADLLRAGVTLSPEFMARNFLRDTLSGFLQSEKGLFPVVGTIDGFKEVATRSDVAKLWRAFGGAHADMWKGDSEQTRKILHKMATRGEFDARTILTPGGILNVLQRLGSISEAGTRVAEFKKTADPGKAQGDENSGGFIGDRLIDAAYNSREVSVDFGMRGHSKTIRLLTRITPFLNPAIQGWYKSARTGTDHFARTAIRGSMLAAFSVALYLLNKDSDWYDEIEAWEKNTYWHFDIGLRDDGKVVPLRVPKPFEWGALFGSVPEALAKVAIDGNGKEFAERLGTTFTNVFALRVIPNAVLVPMELWGNQSLFTGRQIVSESKEKLDPAKQYGPQTSLAARAAGEVTDTSPAKIDHAIRGFLGTMGTYVLAMTDVIVRATGNEPAPPKSTWTQWPVVRAFVHDPNNPNSRFVTEFYESLQKARRAEATLKQLEADDAIRYREKHEKELESLPAANRAARQMGSLRKDNEQVLKNRDLRPEDKRQTINENNARIKAIAKGVMQEPVRP